MGASNQPITFTHAMRIAGYSWPLYAAAGLGIVVAVSILLLPASPLFLRWIAAVAALTAGWFAIASFCAFHWMFDRSELLGGKWLREEFPQAPVRWVQINAGLEETTLPLVLNDEGGMMNDEGKESGGRPSSFLIHRSWFHVRRSLLVEHR
jgi:hypothetical protein